MADSPLSLGFKVDANGPINLFERELPGKLAPALKKGAGKAAYKLQQLMRSELDRLIYSTPEPPNYRRTHTLMRSTYASRPGANHSHDHEAAASGVDLAITEDAAGGVVKMTGWSAEIEVGAWANYAEHVHEGHGLGTRVPKPFAIKALDIAGDVMQFEIGRALDTYLKSIVK